MPVNTVHKMRLFSAWGRKKEDSTEGNEQTRQRVENNLLSAIVKNREAIEVLEKRRTHMLKREENLQEDARKRAQMGDRNGALLVLKRKKVCQQELEQLTNAHMTLERQIMALESAQSTQIAVGALQSGVAAQKEMSQHMDINKMDELMESMQEQQQLQEEVNQVLSQGNDALEDEALLAELSQIQSEQLEAKLSALPSVPTIAPGVAQPHVPTGIATPVAAPQAQLPISAGYAGGSSLTVPSSPSVGAVTTPDPFLPPTVNFGSATEGQRNQLLSDEEQLKQLQAELG